MVLRMTASASRIFQRGMATKVPLLKAKDQRVALEPSPREKLAQIMTERTSLPLEATSLAFLHYMKRLEEKKGSSLSPTFKITAWKLVHAYSLEKTQELFRRRILEDVLVHLTREETVNAIQTIEGDKGVNHTGWQKLALLGQIYKEPLRIAEIHEAASHWDRWSHDLRSLIEKELLKNG